MGLAAIGAGIAVLTGLGAALGIITYFLCTFFSINMKQLVLYLSLV